MDNTPSCLEIDNQIAYCLAKIPWFIGYYGLEQFMVNDELRVGEIFEKGDLVLNETLEKNILSYQDKISIMVCVLLGIREARRRYQFKHYDLHCGNIVLVTNAIFLKEVIIGGSRVTEYKYSPRIIDFGQSSITMDDGSILNACSPSYFKPDDVRIFILTFYDLEAENLNTQSNPFADLLSILLSYKTDLSGILEYIAGNFPEIYSFT